MSLPNTAIADELLKNHVNKRDWGNVKLLVTNPENQPGKKAIAYTLEQAAYWGQPDLVTTLCTLETDNKPNQEAVNKALKRAADGKEWGIIEYFCKFQTENIPNQNLVNYALNKALSQRHWNTVSFLCAMKGDNKPDDKTIAYTLGDAAYWGLPALVTTLCTLETDNKPNQEAVNKALKRAADGREWGVAEYLCCLQTENKPNQEAVTYALEKASLSGQTSSRLKELKRKQAEEIQQRKQQEELLRRQEEESRKHQQYITTVMSKIDNTFATLQQKISLVEQHHSSEAFEKAVSLLSKLKSAQQQYKADLHQPNVNIPQANKAFKTQCETLIKEAKPVLERDLGWGNYLNNLLKTIANAIIWGFTFGQVNTFFCPIRSVSVQAIEKAEECLVLEQQIG